MPLSPHSSHFTSNGQLKTDRSKPKYYGQSSNNNSGKSQNSGTNNKESHYNTYRANNFGDLHTNSQRKNQVEERNDKSGEKHRGTVEKLLNSYGFVELPHQRQRVFFHYSEYDGDPDDLEIGDYLEFELGHDPRNGKLLAKVVKKAKHVPAVVSTESDERCSGTVEMAPRQSAHGDSRTDSGDLGRISYNRNGEFFFLPFSLEDIREGEIVRKGDCVSFIVTESEQSGSLEIDDICYANPEDVRDPVKTVMGIISSLKDSFGFIERSDVVAEIFFHYSEFDGNINDVNIGDDVQFELFNRQGKDIAVRVEKLATGTVVFEDISPTRYQGHVIKAVVTPRGGSSSDGHLTGLIEYQESTDTNEVLFGDRDIEGDIALQSGDVVEFNVSTDRRDKLQRAVSIKLITVAVKDGQQRETGAISSLKDGFGFIKCAERDLSIFFHYSEVLEQSSSMNIGDEVEFTIDEDSMSGRQHAVRIKFLPRGTVVFEVVSKRQMEGIVEKEAPLREMKSPSKHRKEYGIINAEVDGMLEEIMFSQKDCSLRNLPKLGDIVLFTLVTRKANSAFFARDVSVLSHNKGTIERGWICALKENFGFIELQDHSSELFFHYSELNCDANDLELGDIVEYQSAYKNGKPNAEAVSKISSYVERNEILPTLYDGIIVRSMRILDPEQDEYQGVVEVCNIRTDATEFGSSSTETASLEDRFTFGICSKKSMSDPLQIGDKVEFQLSIDAETGECRPVNMQCKRKFVIGKVESIKGQFGFIAYETEDGKSLFFHMSEVEGLNGKPLQPGDSVQFVIVRSHKNAKKSAVKVSRISGIIDDRPDHLTRRRSQKFSESCNVKLLATVLRQPHGPDNSGGFKLRRKSSTTCPLIPVPSQAAAIEVF